MADELLRALGRVANDFDFLSGARALGRVEQQQLRRAEDSRQDVVEVVRHAPGEPADGLELLGLGEVALQLHAFATHPGVGQRTRDGGRQALQPVLHDVVSGAGPHSRHRGVLTDGAGYDDEREVLAGRLQHRQRPRSVESREVVIAQHDIPRLTCQCRAERLGGFDALVGRDESATPQLAQDHFGVGRAILDEERAERRRCGGHGIGHDLLYGRARPCFKAAARQLMCPCAPSCLLFRWFFSRHVTPARSPRDTVPARRPTQPVAVRDTQLENRVARLELRQLEKEAQVEELQARLDDARREVVRAMAKLQSLATRAEAASGMAEAEIALQALRTSGNPQGVPELGQAAQLLQLAAAEFDKQNYGGALYLANQAKDAAAAGQGRVASVERGALRQGEVPFALPLRLQTAGRAKAGRRSRLESCRRHGHLRAREKYCARCRR